MDEVLRRQQVSRVSIRHEMAMGVVALGLALLVMGCSPAGPHTSPPAEPSLGASSLPGASQPSSPTATIPSGPPFSGTAEEWLAHLYDCIRQEGWTVSRLPDGGYQVAVPPGQQDAFRRARDSCATALGPAPSAPVLSQTEIRARYTYLVSMRDCLIGLGYTISEPPSIDEFVDTWATGPWSPYNDLANQTGPSGWEEANRTCPQIPNG